MRRLGLLAAAVFATALAAPPASSAAATCGPTGVPGGEWRSMGHDYANTRTQDRERVISPADVPLLTPAWTFSTKRAELEGDITGTPIIADGCLYTGTTGGGVAALNADTGDLVWKAKSPSGGGIFGSVAVDHGLVYAAVSRNRGGGCPPGETCGGPYVAAFDQDTGRLVWSTGPLDTQPGSDIFGSPVVFDGVLLIGISGGSAELGDEADRYAFQGSLNLINASTGALMRRTWTVHPPKQPDDDLAGAGIWSTPAVEPEAKVAYVGTANPFRPQAEDEHANAVLKIDLDRASPTFGEAIGSYKGTIDEYVPGLSKAPCYDFPGNSPPYYPQGLGACGDIDLDFGASPNLFTDSSGRRLVGAGQKSGVYHAFDARTMAPVWKQIVGPPGSLGGIVGSTAVDGGAIFGPVTVPGYAWSLSTERGQFRWVAPILDGAHWSPPVSVANGVVYSVDLTGFLDAFDERTGLPLAKRPLMLGGTNAPLSLSWGGVAVARNTVYAAVGMTALPEGFIVAYRPGAPSDLAGDVQETAAGLLQGGGDGGDGDGGGGGGALGTAVVAAPGAASTTYATPLMVTQVGGPLSFLNLDIAQHDVTAQATGQDGKPLFGSRLIGLGQTAPVEGLDRVEAGKTYAFYCTIHPGMRGTLVVR